MKIKDHRLEDAIRKETKNKGSKIIVPEFIVHHYTVGSAASAISKFMDPNPPLASAHLLITRGGEIYQFAPFNVATWHAGKSAWEHRLGCNNFTIGIEYENEGPLKRLADETFRDWYGGKMDGSPEEHPENPISKYWDAYPKAQIEAGLSASAAIVEAYGIRGMLRHSDVAPARKIDPGPAFPLRLFEDLIDTENENEDNPDIYAVVPGVDLTVRTGPGTQYSPQCDNLTTQLFEISESAGNWVQIEKANRELSPKNTLGRSAENGWVNKRYIQKIN